MPSHPESRSHSEERFMSNVFDQAFALSQTISERIIERGLLKLKSGKTPEVFVTSSDPFTLLNSYGTFFPESAHLIILDTPRASKRVPVELFDFNESGEIEKKAVKIDDPNYKYLLTANILAAARFLGRALSDDGILVAVTTPDIYLATRGALEHYLGSDKFLGELVYQSRSGGGSDSLYMSVDHETLLVFCKQPGDIDKFQLEKSADELSKYNLNDKVSPYYWDTYIRKQARNYYSIDAPDGTTLETDENGNPISWLWKKDTYTEKLAVEDIKFEKISNKWKLYYKDRLKDVKILRSLSINATLLKELSDEAPEDMTGGDLLNSKGSAEIKAYTGNKPDYLKPSGYYKFIYKVFNKRGGVTLVPYSEYGALVQAVSDLENFNSTLIVNVKPEHVSLVKWRNKKSKLVFSDNELFNMQSFFQKKKELNSNLCLQLLSIKHAVVDPWNDFKQEGLDASYSITASRMLFYVSFLDLAKPKKAVKAIGNFCAARKLNQVLVFSQYDNALIEPVFLSEDDSPQFSFFRLPQLFFK